MRLSSLSQSCWRRLSQGTTTSWPLSKVVLRREWATKARRLSSSNTR